MYGRKNITTVLVLGLAWVLDVPAVELALAASVPYIGKYNFVNWLKLTI